jgi:carbonic anhydrase
MIGQPPRGDYNPAMSTLSEILAFNQQFVADKAYEAFLTDRFPDKKMVIVTCMDTRLTELLPKAMNLRNGDAKIIKIAGAIVAAPFGSVMRSILVAIYLLGAEEIYVVGHYDCGMTGMGHEAILQKARTAGVADATINMLTHAGIDLESWLTGFASPTAGVEASVRMIKEHPLLPRTLKVHGLVMHPDTGKLDLISDGNAA